MNSSIRMLTLIKFLVGNVKDKKFSIGSLVDSKHLYKNLNDSTIFYMIS